MAGTVPLMFLDRFLRVWSVRIPLLTWKQSSVTKETSPPILAYAFSFSDWWDTQLDYLFPSGPLAFSSLRLLGQVTLNKGKKWIYEQLWFKSRYFCSIKVSHTTAQFHLFLGHDTFSKPYGAQHFEYFGP